MFHSQCPLEWIDLLFSEVVLRSSSSCECSCLRLVCLHTVVSIRSSVDNTITRQVEGLELFRRTWIGSTSRKFAVLDPL